MRLTFAARADPCRSIFLLCAVLDRKLAALYARAAGAARLPDLDVRVQDAHGRVTAVPQWDELRIWDPGD